MNVRRSIATVTATLLLASCGARVSQLPSVHAAETASGWAEYLLVGGGLTFRPTALLGTYVAGYLGLGSSMSQSALLGAQQEVALFFAEAVQQSESYQLLQDLGSALAVNIQDMLNRSANRATALDAYVTALKTLDDAGKREQDALTGQSKAADTVLSAKRKAQSDVQRQIDTAVRNKDYSTAGSLQPTLNSAQMEVTTADSTSRELSNLLAIYRTALQTADTRITAITANRDALIAGVKISDVPGIADIGVVEGNPSTLQNAGNNGFFGGL